MSSFKIAAPIGHLNSINQQFELDYLICGDRLHIFTLCMICFEYSCIISQNVKWTSPLISNDTHNSPYPLFYHVIIFSKRD